MNTTSEDGRSRWKNLCIISFFALTVVATAVAQDTITNFAQLAEEPFRGDHSIYLPLTPWQWQAFSTDGGEPWWLDCSQLPCMDLLPASTNLNTSLQAHGVQVVGVLLTKNVLTGETTLQPDGSTDVVARIAAPSDYQPGALSEDRGVWRMWQEATNCPDCWGIEGVAPPPTVVLRVLLADITQYPTYASNVEAEAEVEAAQAADAVAQSAGSVQGAKVTGFAALAEDAGGGMMMLMDSGDPCVITNDAELFSITGITVDATGATIAFESCSDHVYVVQATSDLTSGSWTDVAWMWGDNGTTAWADSNTVGQVQQFYRVVRANPNTLNNGIPYGWAVDNGLDPLDPNLASEPSTNPWAHGLTNLQVYQNPSVLIADNYSTLGDGIPDWWKVTYGFSLTDPAVASEPSTNPWAHGLTNLQVYQNPSVLIADNYSTVGDGIPDWWKVTYGFSLTDPTVASGDPTGDGWSNLEKYLNNSNPLQYDDFDFIVNDGQTYSPSLGVTIQAQDTNYPDILISLDSSMSNATVLANSGGSISYTLPDNGDGGYELFLQYADAQGQPHGPILSKNVVVDRVPPVVYITSPASTAILNQEFITLQAVAADPNPVVPDAARPLNIWINGQPFWDREGTNIVVNLLPVPAGTNSFTVTILVTDQAGNTNQASQTWTVDTSTATNAPNLLTVNLSSTMLLPDVDSIWMEGDIDNGNALVSALVSSDPQDVTTNSLNVWKQHYEGLVPLSSGTNQVVLLASDAAGNSSSMFFTIVRSTRFQAAITSPAFGDFATAPSNTVSGYVSAVFDAGLPTQTNVVGVTINGVAATLHWDQVDENGNVPFDSTQQIPLGEPITGQVLVDGSPTDPPPSIPPAMSQVYEVTHKAEVHDDIVYVPMPEIAQELTEAIEDDYGIFNLTLYGGCWTTVWNVRNLVTVTQDWVEASSQVQSNQTEISGGPPSCLTTLDPDRIAWNMGDPSTSSSMVAGPIGRGLSFGTYSYDHGPAIFQEDYYGDVGDTWRYRMLLRSQDSSSSIRFRAPRGYGTNTTVILTFEGMDYRQQDGATLDLSQVRFRGQSPIAYSNETQTVSYLLTVNGGQEYTINQDDFQWPADQQLYTDNQAGGWPGYGWWFSGTWTEDMHWLTWTNFHNAVPQIIGPTNLYVYCNSSPSSGVFYVTNAVPASSVNWSVTSGSDKVQINSTSGVATPTDANHASTNVNDVTVSATVTFQGGQSATLTTQLTVRKPWTFGQPSIAYSDPPQNYATDAWVSYRVLDQFCQPFPAALISGTAATESFQNKPSCYQPAVNGTVHSDGTALDNIAVPYGCQSGEITYQQAITVDCATVTNSIVTDPGTSLNYVIINRIGGPTCP